MDEAVRRQGRCRWLPSDTSMLNLVRQLTEVAPGGRASIEGEQGVPGVLTLTGSYLQWEIHPFVRGLVETAIRAFHAPVPDDLFDRLTWRLPLETIRSVDVEGGLLARSLVLRCADRTELFKLPAARRWCRAIQAAAGIVPDEGLSRAAEPAPAAEETSLSRAEQDALDV